MITPNASCASFPVASSERPDSSRLQAAAAERKKARTRDLHSLSDPGLTRLPVTVSTPPLRFAESGASLGSPSNSHHHHGVSDLQTCAYASGSFVFPVPCSLSLSPRFALKQIGSSMASVALLASSALRRSSPDICTSFSIPLGSSPLDEPDTPIPTHSKAQTPGTKQELAKDVRRQ